MNPTQPRDRNGGELPAVVVIAVTAILIAAIGGAVFLAYLGKPVDTLLILLSSLVAPTIASLIAVRKLGDVAKKVDGKISNLISDKANLEHQVSVAGFTPVTATVSFDPASNTGPIPKPVMGEDSPETDPPTNPYHVADVLRRLEAEKEGKHNGG